MGTTFIGEEEASVRKLLLVLGLLAVATTVALRVTQQADGPNVQLLALWSYLAIVRGLGLDRWLVNSLRLARAEMRGRATAPGRVDA